MTNVIRQESPAGAVVPAANMVGGMAVSEAAVARAVATKAEIESRYLMALQRPRDLGMVRDRLMTLCADPSFAEEAIYKRPMGKKDVTGLSIRFTEAALQCLTNVFTSTTVLYEDDETRVLRVVAMDLECNVSHSTDVSVAKVVERSRVDPGRRVVGERINSRGRRTYLIAAGDDEVQMKAANLASKALRNVGLRLVPASLLVEAERMLMQGAQKAAGRPDATARIVDAFEALGVSRADLEGYLETPLEKATPEQIADLRSIHTGITDGEFTWADMVAGLDGTTNAEAEQAKNPIADAKEPYGVGVPRASGHIASTPVEEKPKPGKR